MPLDQSFSAAFLRGGFIESPSSESSSQASDAGVAGASHEAAPARYVASRDGTPERFMLGPHGAQFSREVRAVLSQLREFAAAHQGEVDHSRIHAALHEFETDILGLNGNTGANLRFGPRADWIYGPAKDLLDGIGKAMANEALPLTTRLRALQSMAEDVNVCADGVLTQLTQCLRSIDSRHSGLLDVALKVSDALLQQALMEAILQRHGANIRQFPGDELHFLTGLQQVIFPELGRTPPEDRLAKAPSRPLVEQARSCINRIHRPSTLALAVADRVRDQFETDLCTRLRLPLAELRRSFVFDEPRRQAAEAAALGLEPDFGPLPLDTLLDWTESADEKTNARLHNNSILMAVYLVGRLRAFGILEGGHEGPVQVKLRSSDSVGGAITLHVLDSNLFWVEQFAAPRGLLVDDLPLLPLVTLAPSVPLATLSLPLPAPAPGQTLRELLTAPSNTATTWRHVKFRHLTHTALQNAWPGDAASFRAALLLGASTAELLVQKLNDKDLADWLRRDDSVLHSAQHRWLQEALVLNGRVEHLAVIQLRDWMPMTISSTSPHLWRMAVTVASEPMLSNVGEFLLLVTENAVTDNSGPLREPYEGGPPTPNAGRWLLECMGATGPNEESPLSTLLHERPQLAGAAMNVMLKAHEKGLVSRLELLSRVAANILSDPRDLSSRLCELPSTEPLRCYVTMVDSVHDRINLTPEELSSFFDVGASSAAFNFAKADAKGPLILMNTFGRWLLQGRLQPHQWMDLMTIDHQAQDGLGHNAVAVRLMTASPDAVRAYLDNVCATFATGHISKAQLLSLLQARQPGHPEIPTLASHLSMPFDHNKAGAATRLRLFFTTLLELAMQGLLTRDDIRTLLLEPDSSHSHPWIAVGSLPPHDPRHQAVKEGLDALTHHRGLTPEDVRQLLQDTQAATGELAS